MITASQERINSERMKEEDNMENTDVDVDGLDYSFACGGWLKLYLFGVAKFLQEQKLITNSKFIGCSAGALAATGLALGANFDEIRDFVLNVAAPRAHGSLVGALSVRDILRECLDKHGNLHLFETVNASQSLVVSYSSLTTCTARRVSTFVNEGDLSTALLASCCATPIAGLPFRHAGEWVFDGGLTDFQPVFDEKTVTISPLYCTNAEIRPSRYVPIWWAMYPPERDNLEWLYELGYHDAHAWAYKKKLVQHTPDLSRVETFHVQWDTRLGRVLGYRALESKILDALFICAVILLWKPLAFSLMYMELGIRAVLFAVKAIMFGLACKLMMTLSISGLLASLSPVLLTQQAVLTCLLIIAGTSIFFISLVLSVGKSRAADFASRDWKTARACLRNIASLSLLLRTIPAIGAAVPLKRHQFLLEHSFVYRVTNHFM